MFSNNARLASAMLALLLTYGSSAFAIRFKVSQYNWDLIAGQPFTVDFNTLVTEVDRTQPIVWSADKLPRWARLDARTGVLSGTPDDDVLNGTEVFSLLAVQGNQGDEATIYFWVYPPGDAQGPHAIWFPSAITLQGCVGQPLASQDLQHDVMLSGMSMNLPVPTIDITTINRPAWLVEIRKANGSVFLTGTPPAAGDFRFQARACVKTNCSEIPVEISVAETCLH